MQLLVKKTKFTLVSNTPKSSRENFIQAIHSENNTSWYFTLNDLTALSYDKKNDFSVFHLNIYSLQYHFSKLPTLTEITIWEIYFKYSLSILHLYFRPLMSNRSML